MQNEINKVLSLGVESSRIIFANPAKPASHIRHADAMRVDTMTVDNESELHKIKKFFPTAKVIVRHVTLVNIANFFFKYSDNFILKVSLYRISLQFLICTDCHTNTLRRGNGPVPAWHEIWL